nr:hypothetical protein [uncultured Sphaerochaeta sp.]
MTEKWTKEKAWEWYNARPWITGCNFIPSNTRTIELWQEYGHEEIMPRVREEVELAAGLGLNSMRVFFPIYVWKNQHDAFLKHLEELLTIMDEKGITMMPVLFGDCLVPKSKHRDPVFGRQPDPVPGYFGGEAISPFDEAPDEDGRETAADNVGWSPYDDRALWPEAEAYVKELARIYGKDERIIIWNVWNEAGNSNRLSMSGPLMTKAFQWLREMDVVQPLTADVWGAGADHPHGWLNNPRIYAEIEDLAIELSDVVSFHFYGDYTHLKQYIAVLEKYGRPLLNTEWMHRPFRSIIQTHLPVFKKEKIGSYFFGFVNGKAQFNYVWNFIKGMPDIDTRLWMHDIFHSDFTPYDPEEIEVIKDLCLE